jgi:hypothetical protein
MDFVLGELDLQNQAHIADFERALFTVFAPLTHNLLIRKLWLWDEANCRLKTRVPYAEQTIFVSRDADGNIETALALGVSLETAQSAAYGFAIEKDEKNCEALAFFGLGERQMRHTQRFWKACRETLLQRGVENIYGTCAPRVMPVYKWVGAQVLDTREIENETRLFFHINLLQATRRKII